MSFNTEDKIKRTVYAIRKIPPLIYALLFVGRIGVATHTQLYDLLEVFLERINQANNLEKSITKLIAECLMHQYLREINPEFDTQGKRILYLTQSGFEKVREFNAKLTTGLIYDVPTPYRSKQILHDLISGDGYIWLTKLGYVYDFKGDSILRGENMRLRHKVKNSKFLDLTEVPDDSSLPDFQIGLIYYDDLHTAKLNCESVIKYSREHISKKHRIHKYFTSSEYMANNIEVLTGLTPKVFSPLDSVSPASYELVITLILDVINTTRWQGIQHLNPLENRVYKLMQKLKVPLTVEYIGEFIRAKKNDFNQALSNLKNTGYIKSRHVHVTYDSRIKRLEYFYLSENERFHGGTGFYSQLVLTEVMILHQKNEYRPVQIDIKNLILIVAQDDYRAIEMIDDSTQSIHKMIEKLKTFENHFQDKISLVVTDETRKKYFKTAYPELRLISFSSHLFQ